MTIAERLAAVIAVLLVLKISSLVLFGRYIADEIKKYGWHRRRLRAAVALQLQELGNLIVFSWILVFLVQVPLSDVAEWMLFWPVSVIGGLITAIGLLYKIRMFAPERCGNMGWIISLIIAIIAAVIVIYIDELRDALTNDADGT